MSVEGQPSLPVAPIEIRPYDPEWPRAFAAERLLLEELLAPWLVAEIEHVGSTAVPGLAAKPIIDIMAPVGSLTASRPAISTAAVAAYVYAPYKSDVMHWFCKPSPTHRTHHLHLVPHESELWFQRLRFRDLLRQDSALARDYGALKTMLAKRYQFDRTAYTEAKSIFIKAALAD